MRYTRLSCLLLLRACGWQRYDAVSNNMVPCDAAMRSLPSGYDVTRCDAACDVRDGLQVERGRADAALPSATPRHGRQDRHRPSLSHRPSHASRHRQTETDTDTQTQTQMRVLHPLGDVQG
eukprot:3940336-Rhodomonas_salina.2